MSIPLKLYSAGTPNGNKITIFLEFLGLKYDLQKINIRENEQKQDWFVKINANGRIPALVDSDTGVTISQTAAILQYLADTYDKDYKFSYKPGTIEYYKQLEYLIYSVAEQGPITGQLGHFTRAAPEKIPYAIERYTTDVKRILGVLDDIVSRNKDNGYYFVGPHYSIADFSVFGWARSVANFNIDITEYEYLGPWFTKLSETPEVKKGLEAHN
ncbi:glutathione S-transferase [Scheffersomyces coipomensis]|uniref:glutathione S-transferase n=1 Tax=Scheffersomyces coipomensis TaxID=1788519 RepID=UPI00315D447D